MSQSSPTLPVTVRTRADVARLSREVRAYDEVVRESQLRSRQIPELTSISESLSILLATLKVDLKDAQSRHILVEKLQAIHQGAPVVHLSFATQPSSVALDALVGWFRMNAHAMTLIEVSVLPSIVAGCRIRTTNQVFNFSLSGAVDAAAPALSRAMGYDE